MTTTTYFGLSQGANEANTEVAFLPSICAVPVLPATQTLFSGKPANVLAAVPWVTTPASAWRMYARVSLDALTWRVPLGSIFRTTWPDADTRASPIVGAYSVPPLASVA